MLNYIFYDTDFESLLRVKNLNGDEQSCCYDYDWSTRGQNHSTNLVQFIYSQPIINSDKEYKYDVTSLASLSKDSILYWISKYRGTHLTIKQNTH